jgi:hypothetical protein
MKSLNRRPCSPTMMVWLRRIAGPGWMWSRDIPKRTRKALVSRGLVKTDAVGVCRLNPRGRVALRMGR